MTTMTVRQLIEKLEEYGDDLPVYFSLLADFGTLYYSISIIEFINKEHTSERIIQILGD
jgi:hypothetical protein